MKTTFLGQGALHAIKCHGEPRRTMIHLLLTTCSKISNLQTIVFDINEAAHLLRIYSSMCRWVILYGRYK